MLVIHNHQPQPISPLRNTAQSEHKAAITDSCRSHRRLLNTRQGRRQTQGLPAAAHHPEVKPKVKIGARKLDNYGAA